MARLGVNYRKRRYTFEEEGKWSGPHEPVVKHFQYLSDLFFQQYGPEHGPPMSALLRWMKEEVTGLKGAFVSDDDELEVVH